MSTSDVITACQQLVDEGKEPSVALIKPRLPSPLPLPTIIAGLKSFKANPNQAVSEKKEAASTVADDSLEQRVQRLEEEVVQLKSMIQQLQA